MIGFITKLVKTITFKRVVIWTIAMAVGIVSYTAYEKRDELFLEYSGAGSKSVANPVGFDFQISEASKTLIKDLVHNDKTIVAIGILSADIRLNSRQTVYFYRENDVSTPAEISLSKSVHRLPLFNSDDENNRQIVKIINGEFNCLPYKLSALSKAAPTLNKDVLAICRSSLPPYYGYFAGFISVFLAEEPTAEQQIRLRTEVDALANELYFKDVIPTSKKIR